MTYLSIGLRVLLTIAFMGAGGVKLAGVEMMITTFDQIGFGQGLRYLTGSIEIVGAALLWMPRKQVIGAALLGGTMLGAVMTHWFILGPSALPSIVLGLLCSAVLYIHRDQIAQVLGRASTSSS
ncbi:DoxX family protein [Planktotalea arctica]|uniref:DoxX family protein n=1 Tax=Planktotalea arctica TaxID=1481893 RepID=UPI00321AD0F2